MKNQIKLILLGIAIPTCILPIGNALVELVLGQCEIAKGGQVKKITQINIDNAKLQEQEDEMSCPVSTNAIGFEIPSEEEFYDDDEQ